MAVRVNNIFVNYGNTQVIKGASLQVPKGSFCCVIGPNGCGKSTLLKAISRNLKVLSGEIYINGRLLGSYDTRILSRDMAFLAQSPHVPEQFSVRDLVSYGRFPHTGWMGVLTERDHKVINWAMEITEVMEFEEREMVHLSGGERQRVWIAMALAQEAGILLLDEPTTYLDIAHQFSTLELIKKLNKDMNRTVLMVIHDLNQAARYADYIYVMENGRINQSGTPEEIITEKMLKKVFSIETRVIKDTENNCPYFIPLREAVWTG